ncbi:rab-GTPase-TBC domain-containing protein [Mycotypha africana]|uniref:rab-GTPase-TBC domain-containing protein n=1 Tax=Mycotypha africana TaxID=64632 RepID=UPI002301B224|nr:rab-GTPase-TBC domain-containing protein [Mycotypha africana]KAI8970358.1 rab-GTPase-TBC domain-containing protein [Mycotypha africana]
MIKKDVYRTYPDNIRFSNNSSSNDQQDDTAKISLCPSLYRVLAAFSQYAPDIGYCQSLNFLVGFLLLVFDNEEEKVFWMLVTIVQDYFPAKMFDKTMEGGNLEQMTFMLLVYEKMPGVWSKMSNKKCFWQCEEKDELPAITLVTNHWFLTMFINILPVETVLRIWDCFFVGEGFTILYQVALTIMRLNEQQILAINEPTDIFRILQNTPKRMIDCDEFIKVLYKLKREF